MVVDDDATAMEEEGAGDPFPATQVVDPAELAPSESSPASEPPSAPASRCAPHAQRPLTLHTLSPHTPHALARVDARFSLLHKPARLVRRKRRMVAPPQMAAPSPAVQTAVKPKKKKVAAASSSDDSNDMDVESEEPKPRPKQTKAKGKTKVGIRPAAPDALHRRRAVTPPKPARVHWAAPSPRPQDKKEPAEKKPKEKKVKNPNAPKRPQSEFAAHP